MNTIYQSMVPCKSGFEPAYSTTKPEKFVATYTVDDAELALPFFQKYYGKHIGGNFSWQATDAYATEAGRQSLIWSIEHPQPNKREPRVHASFRPSREKLIKCACGHSVPRCDVMSAGGGDSYPACYDRMS